VGYYRYKRRYRGWRSKGYTPSKYTSLTRLLGDAVNGIKHDFLSLDDEPLEYLLKDYKDIYGSSAMRYARSTFSKWKSGETKLSGQTMERLIELVPPYLSPEQRFDLLRQVLRKHPPSKPYKSIRINVEDPEEGFSEIDIALESLIHEDILAHVPEKVMKAASWLYDDDITVARSMLAEAERKENDIIQDSSWREVELLKRTIRSGHVKSASYSVKMPAGTLSIVAYKPSKCFVASVCFGRGSNEVITLQDWRDNSLMHIENGRKFIIWYYQNGETISHFVDNNPFVKGLVHFTLKLFVGLLNIIIKNK